MSMRGGEAVLQPFPAFIAWRHHQNLYFYFAIGNIRYSLSRVIENCICLMQSMAELFEILKKKDLFHVVFHV